MEELYYLPHIKSPDDVKRLSLAEMEALAAEIRQTILETVSRNGGHLASNLGVVELCIAIAYVFDWRPGADRLIFDVGHQSYTWKLLTGRWQNFASLRRKAGLSGFPRRSESPYDFYEAGHASTAISIAEGYARADRWRGEEHRTLVLVGDGALTGGVSFEAMNDLRAHRDRLLIILNDNEMSIDANVGGLSRHLEALRISRGYRRIKEGVAARLEKLPQGARLAASLQRWKKRLRRFIHAQSDYFEALGLRYYGPVDGSHLAELIRYFEALRDTQDNVLIHVCTQKGAGYAYAEEEPARYHGVSPFALATGVQPKVSSQPSFSALVGSQLTELGRRYPDVFAITAAMAQGTGLSTFAEAFPERFLDVGIAEQHAVALAAGLALGGAHPFVAIYSTFTQRAVDQILHDVCLEDLPVCFLLDRSGLVGADGPTHQGLYDLNLFASLPNLSLYAPADAEDLQLLLELAHRSAHPWMIRYPKSSPQPLSQHFTEENVRGVLRMESPEQEKQASTGELTEKDLIPVQKSCKVTALALGTSIGALLEAAAKVRKFGIELEIYRTMAVNVMQINVIIQSLNNTHRLFLVEEDLLPGGFATSVLSALRIQGCQFSASVAAVHNALAGQASREERLQEEGLDGEGLAAQLRTWLDRESKKAINPCAASPCS